MQLVQMLMIMNKNNNYGVLKIHENNKIESIVIQIGNKSNQDDEIGCVGRMVADPGGNIPEKGACVTAGTVCASL